MSDYDDKDRESTLLFDSVDEMIGELMGKHAVDCDLHVTVEENYQYDGRHQIFKCDFKKLLQFIYEQSNEIKKLQTELETLQQSVDSRETRIDFIHLRIDDVETTAKVTNCKLDHLIEREHDKTTLLQLAESVTPTM